jgi:hypothetical protein
VLTKVTKMDHATRKVFTFNLGNPGPIRPLLAL